MTINVRAWQYYLRCYRGSYRDLLLSLLASVAQSLIVMQIAALIRYVFDVVIPSGDSTLLITAGLGLVAMHLADIGATLWIGHVVVRSTGNAIQRFRDELLKRLFSFSRSYYTEVDRGALHSKIVHDTLRLERMGNSLAAKVLPALLTGAVLGAVLLYLNWRLSLLILGIAPLFMVVSSIMGRAVARGTRGFHRSIDVFSKGILSVLQTMDLTRIQSAEEFEMERQGRGFDLLRQANAKWTWLNVAYGAVSVTAVAIFGVIILIVGGRAVATGQMTVGALLSFYVAFGLLRPRLGLIYTSIPHVIEGNESLTTLYGVLKMDDARPYAGTRRIAFNGEVRLEGVCFQYKDVPVLRDVNLTILPGSTVAVVGPNGSGKSTVANLIVGFYRPQSGHLYADGQPFDELDITHLRRSIGVVTQDPILFPGTILDNIVYGCPDADRQQVIAASEMATVHEFIQQLPQGYDTLVGEEGVLLSGGQRQRIAIARALLRRPKLLILDEPTNHLDEAAVRQLLSNLSIRDNPPASLIISHDAEVVRLASHTYALQEGRIVASEAYTLPSRGEALPAETYSTVRE